MKKQKVEKVVFITGASSGFGLELAKMYIKDNFKVYGIGISDFSLEGLTYYKCDVRDLSTMQKIVDEIVEKEGRLDIAVSNAGIGISGPVELTEPEDAKRLMDINFFGGFNCIKTCMPIFRKQNYGRMVFTSSIAGFVPLQYQGFYSASKAALDSLISSTRAEIADYKNIKLVSVKPGDAHTGFTDSRKKNENYEGYTNGDKLVKKAERGEIEGMSPTQVALVMYKVSLKKNPPLSVIAGGKWKFLIFLLRCIPTQRLREWAVRKFY